MALVSARKRKRPHKRRHVAHKRRPKKVHASSPHTAAAKSATSTTPKTTPKTTPAPTSAPSATPTSPVSAPSSAPSSTPTPPSTTPTGPDPTPAPDSTPGDGWRTAVPVATVRERLFLNRFGTGFTQQGLAQLRGTGSPESWLAEQLNPSSVGESPKIDAIDSWYPTLRRTPAEKNATDLASRSTDPTATTKWQYGWDLGNWSTLRRMYSTRTVSETMVDFWSAHLHIPTGHDRAWLYRADYDATIRQHALGTFEDLLVECSLHPAMRAYLDNWLSVRNAPNENQGRELLELHTVGREAGYTEQMVKDSAKILSGYTLDWGKTYDAKYDPNAHTTGAVQVLGFRSPNGAADGQAVTLAYLKYLAHHPATAQRIATKLATYFVSDSPSDGLVNFLAKAYTDSGTDIAATLTALSGHPEFLTSEGNKVRTPVADLVATAKALGVQVDTPVSGKSYAHQVSNAHGGPEIFSWPRPDGAPIVGSAWSTASRIRASYEMHGNQAAGWWPTEAATYRSAASWLPTSSLRFDAYVDHLCRTLMGRAASDRLLATAVQGTGVTPNTLITSKHALTTWLFPHLMMSLLNTPDQMTT